MSLKNNWRYTMIACFAGYVTQAIVNNFAPLLFLTFRKEWNISLDRITLLVTINFAVQLLVDFLSAKFIDKIGYRTSIVAAHIFAAAGLAGIGFLPGLFPDPYTGLLLAVILYAIGGGIIEVLISPIVEACPTEQKSAAMSLLHSFYCWGHVSVVIVSTVFFALAGIGNWKILACVWAILPLANAALFTQVPVAALVEEGNGMTMKELLKSGAFWVLALLMVCAGASEQGMSQWSSAFAESGLHVSKTIGDLSGPCFFAAMMGLSRVIYSGFSERIDLRRFMGASCVLCVAAYLLAAFAPHPALSLLGCGLCGLSVGILWPGTFSVAAASCPRGGTVMFALLALAGDLGCSGGPTLVGFVSNAAGGNLKTGLLSAIAFPIALIALIIIQGRRSGGKRAKN
jgi:MFS family permease